MSKIGEWFLGLPTATDLLEQRVAVLEIEIKSLKEMLTRVSDTAKAIKDMRVKEQAQNGTRKAGNWRQALTMIEEKQESNV